MITGKPWIEFTRKLLAGVADTPGIFELADEHLGTLFIGSSGREGLRPYLLRLRIDRPNPCIAASAVWFRYEPTPENAAWQRRMLCAYAEAHGGALPPCNAHVTHEDIAGLLHVVQTDKNPVEVRNGLVRALHDRGFEINEVEGPEQTVPNPEYHVYEVFDPQRPHPADGFPTALPCLVAMDGEPQRVTLRSVRPTALLQMFHQEHLQAAASTAETAVVESMDEAAE